MKASDDIRVKAQRITELLNELGDTFEEQGLPRSYASQIAQFTMREGWQVNPQLMFTLEQRERVIPEGYAH